MPLKKFVYKGIVIAERHMMEEKDEKGKTNVNKTVHDRSVYN